MKNWSIGRKIGGAAGVSILALLVIGGFAYFNTLGLIATSDAVTHTHQMIEAGQGILAGVKEAENSEAQYLITGSRAYLEAFRTAGAAAGPAIQNIRTLTHNQN